MADLKGVKISFPFPFPLPFPFPHMIMCLYTWEIAVVPLAFILAFPNL